MGSSRHGPNKLSNYLSVHETNMSHLVAEGFVLSDSLEFGPYGDGSFLLSGRIECTGGIVVEVHKLLEIVDGEGANPWVQTGEYSYNAALRGVGNILRYDSPHPDAHRPAHHVHRFDVLAEDRDGTVQDLDDDEWPTLGEVLRELRDWYYVNVDRLRDLA